MSTIRKAGIVAWKVCAYTGLALLLWRFIQCNGNPMQCLGQPLF